MSKKELGNTIKKRRKLLKVRQSYLAELSGVGERTIREIESGKGNTTVDVILKLCDVLGMEMKLEVKKPNSGK